MDITPFRSISQPYRPENWKSTDLVIVADWRYSQAGAILKVNNACGLDGAQDIAGDSKRALRSN